MQNACTFIVIELPKTVAKVTIEEALVGHDNYILTTKLQLKELRSSFAVAHIKYIDAYYNFYTSIVAFTNKK